MDPLGDFMVCTNASLYGLGEVIMQEKCAITFDSCKLKDYENKYLTQDLEFLEVIHTLICWIYFC